MKYDMSDRKNWTRDVGDGRQFADDRDCRGLRVFSDSAWHGDWDNLYQWGTGRRVFMRKPESDHNLMRDACEIMRKWGKSRLIWFRGRGMQRIYDGIGVGKNRAFRLVGPLHVNVLDLWPDDRPPPPFVRFGVLVKPGPVSVRYREYPTGSAMFGRWQQYVKAVDRGEYGEVEANCVRGMRPRPLPMLHHDNWY